MASYIEYLTDGTPLPIKHKTRFLIDMAGGREIFFPFDFQPNMVCVVENPEFDAAAYIDSEHELIRFGMPDRGMPHRKRHWLIVPNAEALSKARAHKE